MTDVGVWVFTEAPDQAGAGFVGQVEVDEEGVAGTDAKGFNRIGGT